MLLLGLHINYNKSYIYNLGPSPNDATNVSHILNCQVGSFPFTYLGLRIKPTQRILVVLNSNQLLIKLT